MYRTILLKEQNQLFLYVMKVQTKIYYWSF